MSRQCAAARRRLTMVEMDAKTPLIGPDGPLTLLDAFEGRRQLIGGHADERSLIRGSRPGETDCQPPESTTEPTLTRVYATSVDEVSRLARSRRGLGRPGRGAADSGWRP
ncbi:DUF899 family protein [Kribbella qitaiheensis]|uniref:DUF899 family protein n=1 Tax=Kribbella qitaiheensis TaxID=1544730 RepID=UPI003605E261